MTRLSKSAMISREMTCQISRATSPAEYQELQGLFREYAAELGIDLGFQNFESELESLPSMYGPPTGAALLALAERPPAVAATAGGTREDAVGCVGVRRLDTETCEMKRLYVAPSARGSGLGARLAEDAVKAAVDLGYTRMVLDTLATMEAAMHLYTSLGFSRTEAYYHNPLPNAVYFEKRLVGGPS